MHWAILCEVAQLPACGARGFDPEGHGRDTLFVVRRGDELRAYRNDCPHWPGSPMAWRKDAYLNADGTRIACHSHGAQFEIDTGLCVAGPCVGQSLDALELCVDEDGTVLWRSPNEGHKSP
jgi:nitrite reductase/ring-hydroxylating ferredoxin subunit